MNDEQILARGGSKEDIRQYARENGVDLTKEDFEKEEIEQFDHEYTHEIVCPYCGYEDWDSWEFGGGDGEQSEEDCGRCEKTFLTKRNISINYTTYKIENDYEKSL